MLTMSHADYTRIVNSATSAILLLIVSIECFYYHNYFYIGHHENNTNCLTWNNP